MQSSGFSHTNQDLFSLSWCNSLILADSQLSHLHCSVTQPTGGGTIYMVTWHRMRGNAHSYSLFQTRFDLLNFPRTAANGSYGLGGVKELWKIEPPDSLQITQCHPGNLCQKIPANKYDIDETGSFSHFPFSVKCLLAVVWIQFPEVFQDCLVSSFCHSLFLGNVSKYDATHCSLQRQLLKWSAPWQIPML